MRLRRSPPTVSGELLNIAREALSNAARHASATKVVLQLERRGRRAPPRDRRRRRGIRCGRSPPAGHHGLDNMRRRAESLGGRLLVESEKGGGTRIIVALPLSE